MVYSGAGTWGTSPICCRKIRARLREQLTQSMAHKGLKVVLLFQEGGIKADCFFFCISLFLEWVGGCFEWEATAIATCGGC